MAFAFHPLLSTYPGASFFPNGNLNGPHLALAQPDSAGYWGQVPWEIPEPFQWGLPPAIVAAMEGRGTGVYGLTKSGGGMFNYGWPKYGPVSPSSYSGISTSRVRKAGRREKCGRAGGRKSGKKERRRGRCGERRRRGEEETRRRGEEETRRRGEEEKRRRGEEEKRRRGEEEKKRDADQTRCPSNPNSVDSVSHTYAKVRMQR